MAPATMLRLMNKATWSTLKPHGLRVGWADRAEGAIRQAERHTARGSDRDRRQTHPRAEPGPLGWCR